MGNIYTNPPQSRNEAILRATIDGTEYTDPPQSRIEDLLVELKQAIEGGSVSSYSDLTDKPSINGVTLNGNKTTEDLHILQGEVPYLLSDVSDVSIVADGTTITIAWTDPNDIMDGSTVVTAWAGTKVVRKAGSAPENVFDGTVVVDSKTKNQYASSGYEDANLAEGTYYYRFFPYSENGVYTQGQYGSGTARIQKIYGVEWDGSSSSVLTRTDLATNFVNPNPYYSGMSGTPSSPFDNLMPWSGMTIVEDEDAGTLVRIPKFYYKITTSGASLKIQISPDHETGFKCSPAHMDRGDGQGERDFVYIGRYHCSNSNYKSTTNIEPKGGSLDRESFRTVIHRLGSDIWQNDFAMFWTIRLLYIVEFANWDCQSVIGYGCGNDSSKGNTGYTDSMPYHTGTTQTNRTTYGLGTQYRHIEGLWDNVFDICDGIYADMYNIYVILNPSDFASTDTGTLISTQQYNEFNGFIKSFSKPSENNLEWALLPYESTKDVNTSNYVCDRFDFVVNSSQNPKIPYIGGSYQNKQISGLFYSSWMTKTTSYGNVGSRLMKLPNNS